MSDIKEQSTKKNKFELTILLKPELDESFVKSIHKDLTKYDRNARLDEYSGIKLLAYEIENQGKIYNKANYLYFYLSLAPEQVQELTGELNTKDTILRYLLLRDI